ncbi:derlin-1 [Cylas formicarius]|uniref:derlin-1 n=1 Tax=Cylas formicarius TaxID=197179 RepID=UPI002958543F|nr:derlin-1 [Cylas formicarius]XP_060531361.1 derlin-1 [Cylas formicarius]XP_060531369.1 derlin-1 [Cylas formicarius]XP_060531379.1 derlin-1 [Cylas formicarius]
MSDFGDWYRSVPRFTRAWFTGTVALTLLGRFGLISPLNLILLFEPVKRFQIWRLLTCVLYYPLSPQTGFHYLINLYFLYNYSRRLEEGHYGGRPADYVFMLIFNWICCVIIGLVADMPLLMDPMVLSVLYIWCQLNKDVIVTFWFGTRFKAVFLPWVLLGFNLVMSGGGVMELVGILVGHLYFFLAFKYPQELGGPSLLQTPAFLKQWFPDEIGGVHGFGVPPERPPGVPRGAGIFRGGHNWGQGHVLGGN